MSDKFFVEKSGSNLPQPSGERKVIAEENYRTFRYSQSGNMPSIVGRGGDPFFKGINASKEQLTELLSETETIQDWAEKEKSNKAALNCLDGMGIDTDLYYKMKDGFGEYGSMVLMGFKTPNGVEIPRLKLLDKNGDVIQVLSGPMAMEELNKRALAYKESTNGYEALDLPPEETGVIQDYSGNPDEYA